MAKTETLKMSALKCQNEVLFNKEYNSKSRLTSTPKSERIVCITYYISNSCLNSGTCKDEDMGETGPYQ